jgi:hypothetical protein
MSHRLGRPSTQQQQAQRRVNLRPDHTRPTQPIVPIQHAGRRALYLVSGRRCACDAVCTRTHDLLENESLAISMSDVLPRVRAVKAPQHTGREGQEHAL